MNLEDGDRKIHIGMDNLDQMIADYEEYYNISNDELTLQLQNARRFVSETEKYLKGIYAG